MVLSSACQEEDERVVLTVPILLNLKEQLLRNKKTSHQCPRHYANSKLSSFFSFFVASCENSCGNVWSPKLFRSDS